MRRFNQKQYDAERYRKKKALRRAQNLAWRTANPEAYRAGIVAWRARNRQKVAAQVRAYAKSHSAELRRARLAAYKLSPEQHKAAQRRYRERHPGRRALIRMNRDHTHKQYLDLRIPARLLRIQNYQCASCFCNIRKTFHIDHVIPLSRGGRHSEGNLQLLCKPCNLSKGAKLPIEWRRWKKQVRY